MILDVESPKTETVGYKFKGRNRGPIILDVESPKTASVMYIPFTPTVVR